MARNLGGTISLRFLRELAAPAKGSSFDSFAKDPVYVNVAGRLYEIADFTFVSGPYESHIELQAGRELTDREARAAKDRIVIDGFDQVEGQTMTRTHDETDILVQRMVRLLWHLTPSEITRLMATAPLTEDQRVAICIRIEDATIWRYDGRDVPHYCGNIFEAYIDTHPEYGPQPACSGCKQHPCQCDDEVPF